MSSWLRLLSLILLLVSPLGLSHVYAGPLSAAQSQPTLKEGEWLMAARDFANTRFSPLSGITTEAPNPDFSI